MKKMKDTESIGRSKPSTGNWTPAFLGVNSYAWEKASGLLDVPWPGEEPPKEHAGDCSAPHTVDGRNPAPPKKPWNVDSPGNTNKQWFLMVSTRCRISSIHSMFEAFQEAEGMGKILLPECRKTIFRQEGIEQQAGLKAERLVTVFPSPRPQPPSIFPQDPISPGFMPASPAPSFEIWDARFELPGGHKVCFSRGGLLSFPAPRMVQTLFL